MTFLMQVRETLEAIAQDRTASPAGPDLQQLESCVCVTKPATRLPSGPRAKAPTPRDGRPPGYPSTSNVATCRLKYIFPYSCFLFRDTPHLASTIFYLAASPTSKQPAQQTP